MSRPGSTTHRLLDQLHANSCPREREHGSCWPVVVPAGGNEEPSYYDRERGAEIVVVYIEWCGDCGAADWEVV